MDGRPKSFSASAERVIRVIRVIEVIEVIGVIGVIKWSGVFHGRDLKIFFYLGIQAGNKVLM